MSNRAFVIHASADLKFVRQLRTDLGKLGIDVITSENIIRPGTEFATQLERIIRRTPVVLLALSKSTADRPWVATEISLALSQQLSGEPKLLIPILVDPDAELPFFIKNLQFVDLSSSVKYRDGIGKVADAITSWRAVDETLRQAEESRLRLIQAERLALDRQREEQAAYRQHRLAGLTSGIAALAGAVAALFTGATATGIFKVQWIAPNVLFGFIAGAISGGVAMFLVVTWRNRWRDLIERRRL